MTLKFKMRKRFGTAAATPGQNWKQKSVGHGPPSLAIDQSRILNTFMVALLPCWFSTKNILREPIPKTPNVLKTLTFVKVSLLYLPWRFVVFFLAAGKIIFCQGREELERRIARLELELQNAAVPCGTCGTRGTRGTAEQVWNKFWMWNVVENRKHAVDLS